MKSIITTTLLAATLMTAPAYAAETTLAAPFTQEIHVTNLLANDELPDPGMTPTAILVDYFNGGQYPCWTSHLAYHEDVTIHAGPSQGCREKVSRIVISPTMTADKLKTYLAPFHVEIDTGKYATQIIVVQNTPPTFDSKTGLASISGTAKVKTQAQSKD